VSKELPLGILVTLVVAVLANDMIIDGRAVSHLTRTDGFVLLSFFIIFLYYTFTLARHQKREEDHVKRLSKTRSIFYILAGIFGLALGGEFVVDGAIYITSLLGVSDSTVGLLVLAVGTSLPELATVITASLKNHSNLAVGNIIGSNLFNILWILGLSAIIMPIPFILSTNYDFGAVIFANLALLAVCLVGKKKMVIEKKEGFFFLFLYALYVASLIMRG